MAKERNYGIDLLRLVLMFMVCILHTLRQGGVLSACGAINAKLCVFWLAEVFSYCAVDAFALISGYMASDKPPRFEKPVEMWFQAFFYSFVVTAILTVAGINGAWGKNDIIKCAFPMLSVKFWYFTAYFGCFFTIPVLNRYLFQIDEAAAKKALIVAGILFSLLSMARDPFKMGGGYSMLWLMTLYCMGALAARAKLFETRRTLTLILWWAGCNLLTWAVSLLTGVSRLVNYVTPTVLLSGLLMVVLFSRLKLRRTAKIISKLSPLAFGIYLFQTNQVIWKRLLKNRFAFVADMNIFAGILCVFAIAALIFISGLLVEFVRSRLAAWLKIPALSGKIASAADKCLSRLSVLLK